jgi:hypothetical protein
VSLRPETHPVARQNIGTLNSSSSKSVNALKFLVLSLSNMLCALPEHSWPGYFENYDRVAAASLICGEPLFMM